MGKKLTAEEAFDKTVELLESYKNLELLGGNPFMYIDEYADQKHSGLIKRNKERKNKERKNGKK